MKTKRAYEQAQGLRAQLGTIDVAVVRRHIIPLMADEHGSSLGAQVDNIMQQTAQEHEGVIQSFTVHLFPDQLDAVADYYSGAEG